MRMSTKWVLLLSAVVATSWSFGQGAAEKPAGNRPLEDLIAAALRHSPDLQVADAKVREAQAELRRSRLTLVQKVIDASSAVEAARAAMSRADESFKEVSKIMKAGAMSQEEFRAAEAKLAAAKAQLAQTESTLNGLTGSLPAGLGSVSAGEGASTGSTSAGANPGTFQTGTSGTNGARGSNTGSVGGFSGNMGGFSGGGGLPGIPGGGFSGLAGVGANLGAGGGFGGSPPPVRAPQGPMVEKLHTALNANVNVKPKRDMPLSEVVSSYRSSAGVPFLLQLGEKAKVPVSFSLDGDVQLGAVFQALEDSVPGLKCYVREYGILVTMDDAANVEGAMPLVDFWQQQIPGRK
jgi:hypothetical protein